MIFNVITYKTAYTKNYAFSSRNSVVRHTTFRSNERERNRKIKNMKNNRLTTFAKRKRKL